MWSFFVLLAIAIACTGAVMLIEEARIRRGEQPSLDGPS